MESKVKGLLGGMNTLKIIAVVIAVWGSFPGDVFADLLTFRIAGKVNEESTGGAFVVGRQYTFTFTVDTASPKTVVIPQRGDYLNAVASFLFDYDSGVYTAQALNQGGVSVSSNEFDIFGLGDFPPVAGQTYSGAYFSLIGTSGVVFATTDLPRNVSIDAFQLRQFQINWGIDLETRLLFLSVDSFTLIERRPEISAWSVSTNALILEIQFPNQPYTNILERSFRLGTTDQWDMVTTFVSSGGKTNCPVPIRAGVQAEFYRMRP